MRVKPKQGLFGVGLYNAVETEAGQFFDIAIVPVILGLRKQK